MTAVLGGEAVHEQVAQVLDQPSLLSLAYQPVVDVTRSEVVGYEVLARLPGNDSPAHWFELASACGNRVELELLVLSRAVDRLPVVPRGRFLSVNVSVEVLAETRVAQLVASAGRLARRLVLEITDDVDEDDVTRLAESLAPLRGLGVLVAANAAAVGQEALARLLGLQPDIVKVDATGADGTGLDHVLLAGLTGPASELRAWVIATNVERFEDLDAVARAGVPLAQGYAIGRPDVVLTELTPAAAQLLSQVAEHARDAGIGALARSAEVALTGPAVALDAAGQVAGVVVPGEPGAVRIEPVTLIVYPEVGVSEVARLAMDRPAPHRYDPVVVVDHDDRVIGVLGVDDLLMHLASLVEVDPNR